MTSRLHNPKSKMEFVYIGVLEKKYMEVQEDAAANRLF